MSENRNFTVLGENRIYRGYIRHHKDEERVSTSGIIITESSFTEHRMAVYLEDIVKYEELEPRQYAKKFLKKLKYFNDREELVAGIIEIGKESNIIPEISIVNPSHDLLEIKRVLTE